MSGRSIAQLRTEIEDSRTTLPDAVESYLEAAGKRTEVNAFTSLYGDQARKDAEAIQKKIESGEAGRLAGAIMGIKDIISERGKKVTCASRMLQPFEGVYDATVIEKLKKEDALFIGRTNMDEFGMGSSNENSVFGPARNPHDTLKVTGGSSGGSAAAVAAGFCNSALGSDTGGSIRQPSSFCGIVGLKPTYGRVSRYGLVAYASSFDSIGPLTNTVEDAARVLSVIAGRDKRDGTSADVPVPDYTKAVNNPVESLKIGLPEAFFGEGLEEEIRDKIMDTVQALESDGAKIVPIQLPNSKYAVATYYILATAEASSNLARYDGVRYGYRADIKKVKEQLRVEEEALREQLKKADKSLTPDLESRIKNMDSALIRLYKQTRTEGFGTEVKRRIMLGTYVLSSGYYDAYYAKAQKIRRLIKDDYTRAFENVDVIVTPTSPTTAFDIGSKIDDPLQMYLNDIYTISANLAGICGINVPVGIHSDGLPIGMQFLGDTFQEEKILGAARLVERQYQADSVS